MNCTLTVLDTAGIQSYIFGSNELRENIGASHLVAMATTQWVQDALTLVLGDRQNHNYQVNEFVQDPQRYPTPYRPFALEMTTGERAEVIYAGGGNTVILFAGEDHAIKARELVYELSRRVVATAPGVQLYATHQPYAWGDNLPATINEVMQALAQLKVRLPVYTPSLGLSVTAACVSSGLPANGPHPDPDKNGRNNNGRATLANRANRQVMAQWVAAVEATGRLRQMFPLVEQMGFVWSDDLDRIARLPNRDESFIAVVHADGNGMGRRVVLLTELFKQHVPNQPRPYIAAMRELSLSFQQSAEAALVQTVHDFVQALLRHERNGDLYYHLDGSLESGTRIFPLRPVVFGGDDMTLVSAGPWGLALAHRYLLHLENGRQKIPGFRGLFARHLPDLPADQVTQALVAAQQQHVPIEDAPPYACAGVSIVKTHYPISRAYDNSEALAKSAKHLVLAYVPDKTASALDWHFTTTGLAGKLAEIRTREYVASQLMPDFARAVADDNDVQYSLLMRPLMLNTAYTWRNWDNFRSVFMRFAGGWADGRNKLMALRETLREGPDAAAEFVTLERRSDKLPLLPPVSSHGGVALHLAKGWMTWADEMVASAQLQTWQGGAATSDLLERELNEVRCAYFDAIELQDQFLQLD